MTMLFFLKHNHIEGADAAWPTHEDGSECTIEEVESSIEEVKSRYENSQVIKEVRLTLEKESLKVASIRVSNLLNQNDQRIKKLLEDIEGRVAEIEFELLRLQAADDEFMLLCLLQ